jgi:hypothetical protein
VDRSRVERVRLGWNEQQHPSRARVKGVRHRRWEPEASRREFSLRCHWCSWFSLTSAPVEHYVINRPIQFTDFHCVFFFCVSGALEWTPRRICRTQLWCETHSSSPPLPKRLRQRSCENCRRPAQPETP